MRRVPSRAGLPCSHHRRACSRALALVFAWLVLCTLLLGAQPAAAADGKGKSGDSAGADAGSEEPKTSVSKDPQRHSPWRSSTVEAFPDGADMDADSEPGVYRRFRRVVLHKRVLRAYVDPSSPPEELGSFRVPLTVYPIVDNMKKFDYDLRVEITAADPADPDPLAVCSKRQTVWGPAMIYWAPWSDNPFHYFTDTFNAVYPTLMERGYLDHLKVKGREGAWDLCDFQQRFGRTNITVLTWSKAENRKWSFPFRYMAKKILYINDNKPVCFEEVILGHSMALNWYVDVATPVRQQALRELKWFLKHSAALNHLRAEHNLSLAETAQVDCRAKLPTVACHKPIVVFARRGKGHSRRAVINEPEIIRYVEDKFNVKVISPDFKWLHAYHTLDLMDHAAVFMGIHGAGWTQAMLLPPHAAAAVQIIPYAWHIAYDTLSRTLIYERMVHAAAVQYFQWVNPFAQNAFSQHRTLGAGKNLTGTKLPKPGMRVVHSEVVDQQTYVDLEHFGPVLDRALRAVGVLPRGWPWQAALGLYRAWRSPPDKSLQRFDHIKDPEDD